MPPVTFPQYLPLVRIFPVAYSPRIIDTQGEEALGVMGAVVIEGPRACGKTSPALQLSRSSVRFDTDENAQELAKQGPLKLTIFVRKGGVEPPRPKAQEPKSCVSANFTTPADPPVYRPHPRSIAS
jgi:hypothetical protein